MPLLRLDKDIIVNSKLQSSQTVS